MTEKTLQSQVFLNLNSRSDTRVFRNNVGMGFIGTVIADDKNTIILKNARRIKFGLRTGSADLIGWKSVIITPDMVGKKIAVILSAEVKAKRGRLSGDQKNWQEQLTKAGGIAKTISCIEDAEAIYRWQP